MEVIFMSEVSFDPQTTAEEQENKNTDGAVFDPVCVDLPRIYDSCGAKDCLRDLTVFFTAEDQETVNTATSARVTKASVLSATLSVDSVAFNRGCYSVDILFYFAVCAEVYTGAASAPTTVTGLATYNKRVVLYGSDGSTRSFSSDDVPTAIDATEFNCCPGCPSTLPRATVNVSCPIVLANNLAPVTTPALVPFVPENITEFFGGDLVAPHTQVLSTTLGVFSITQLSRNVQLMIPSYDFCIPGKECEDRTDDPCEAFSRIEFPTDSFFPPACGDSEQGSVPGYGCNCGS
jgi:hypothetical protein